MGGRGTGSRVFGLLRALYLAGLPIIAPPLQVQVVISTCGFRVCALTCLLTFVGNPQINTCSTYSHSQAWAKRWTIWVVRWTCSQLRLNTALLCLLASTRAGGVCPLHHLYSATFFAFLCFLLVGSRFKWPPSAMLKSCLLFLSARNRWCALCWKYMFGKPCLGRS